jgi:cytidine deaminase
VTVKLPPLQLDAEVDRALSPGLEPITDGSSERVSGFSLGPARVPLEWSMLEMRLEDAIDYSQPGVITGVHFPKCSVVLPAWLELCAGGADAARKQAAPSASRPSPAPTRVLVLVSASRAADTTTTSTVGISRLLARHLQVAYAASRVHSLEVSSGDDSDLLRFSDNVAFVRTFLMPRLIALRRSIAATSFDTGAFDATWPKRMRVALSLCDGVPARVTAITSALREYRPLTIHAYNLGSVRRRNQLREKGVAVYPFETVDMHQAMRPCDLNSEDALMVERMRAYAARFTRSLASGVSDLATFWIRKSKKPVLAVLLVTDPDTDGDALPQLPNRVLRDAGSRALPGPAAAGPAVVCDHSGDDRCGDDNGCASEDAAEGAAEDAAGTDGRQQGLKRRRSGSGGGRDHNNNTDAAAAPADPARRVPAAEPARLDGMRVFYGINVEVSLPTGSLCAERNAISNALAALPNLHRRHFRRIAIFGPSMGSTAARHDLHPCGPCKEWLKRIAAVNPDFSILTFESEDWDNQRVFVNSVASLD